LAPGINGTSGTIVVAPAAAAKYLFSGVPGSANADTPFTMTVAVSDAFDNPVPTYRGTAHFSSSDSKAMLPANYAYTAGDNGSHTFTNGFQLKTPGSQTITATDTVAMSITGTTPAINVSAGATKILAVSAPGYAYAGAQFSFTVTAKDQFGNTTTAYGGTVHFSTSDSGAGVMLPPDSTLSNGTGSFQATLVTVAIQTLTATDTGNSSINGSATIAISIAVASKVTYKSYHLDSQQPDRASTWYEVDSALRVTVTNSGNQSIVLGGNMDLWTSAAGYNQDFGIFVGTDCWSGHLLAWKESGGFAGTLLEGQQVGSPGHRLRRRGHLRQLLLADLADRQDRAPVLRGQRRQPLLLPPRRHPARQRLDLVPDRRHQPPDRQLPGSRQRQPAGGGQHRPLDLAGDLQPGRRHLQGP
jgi:hypothetical protein